MSGSEEVRRNLGIYVKVWRARVILGLIHLIDSLLQITHIIMDDDAIVDNQTAKALLDKVSSMFEEKMGSLKRALVDEQQSLSQKIERFETIETI